MFWLCIAKGNMDTDDRDTEFMLNDFEPDFHERESIHVSRVPKEEGEFAKPSEVLSAENLDRFLGHLPRRCISLSRDRIGKSADCPGGDTGDALCVDHTVDMASFGGVALL